MRKMWAVAKHKKYVMENGKKKEVWYSCPVSFDGRSDLISQVNAVRADRIQLAESKKDAEWWADDWNKVAERNDNFMLDYKPTEWID